VSLVTIHSSLVDALGTVDGLRVAETMAPGTAPDRGLAILMPEAITWDSSYGDASHTFDFVVWLYVPESSPRTQLDTLLDLLADVKAKIDAESSLYRVVDCTSFDGYSLNGVNLYGCRVAITATGTA